MLKKMMLGGLAAVLLTFSALGVSAEEIPEGQIYCWLQFGEETVSDGSLEIYRAGDPVPEGYRLGKEFGGGIISGEDIPSAAFARWMCEKAGPGIQQAPERSGLVKFRGLTPGIYLIRQAEEGTDYYPIEPYLACVTEEMPQVDTYPEVLPRNSLPRTAQYSGVYMGTMGIVLALTGLFFCLRLELQNKK